MKCTICQAIQKLFVTLNMFAEFTLTFNNYCSPLQPSCLICINGPAGSSIKLADADGRTEQMEK